MYRESSKVFLLNHFKYLESAAKLYNAQLFLNISNFQVSLSINNQNHILYPAFLEIVHGKPYYSPEFTEAAVCFVGWRPYQFIEIPLLADKLYMKKLFLDNGLLTPEFSIDPNVFMTNVIVKQKNSSFGKGLRGPFKSTNEYSLQPEKGEFFESFVGGEILKIYYWNDMPVCIETQKMPIAVGNGIDTIENLASIKAFARGRDADVSQLNDVLNFQNKNHATVLKEGEAVLLDFRYESDFCDCFSISETPFPEESNEPLIEEFYYLGEVLFSLIKKENIQNLCYTVDAILTESGEPWFLEVNTNPTVHQYIYEEMVNSLSQQTRS
jgi:hypothetical protein